MGIWGLILCLCEEMGHNLVVEAPLGLLKGRYNLSARTFEANGGLIEFSEVWRTIFMLSASLISSHFSPLSRFPKSFGMQIRVGKQHSNFPNAIISVLLHAKHRTKYSGSRNLLGNFLSELILFAEVYVLHLPCTDMGASSCVALVRFGVKMCWGLLWCETGMESSPLFLTFL